MFFRVIEPNVADIDIVDLGVTIPQNTTVTLSNQFNVADLYLSADLEMLIINGNLDVEIDYGTGFTPVLAIDYTNRDALSAFLNVYEISNEDTNEKLVDGSEVTTALHKHDSQYYTETELGSTTPPSGASLIGVDNSAFTDITGTNLQELADSIDDVFSVSDLDRAYTKDTDGILDVDDLGKPLNFRSNNVNDILISRTDGATSQESVLFDVVSDELLLGDLQSGLLNQIDVRVRSDLYVDGNITFNGTITDTTVNEVNVTNANINLRDGAVTDADASITVSRPVAGNDASLLWNETTDRWQAGLDGVENTIALLEVDEIVTGVYELQGGATTEPSVYFTQKTSAPTTNLGVATQIPVSIVNNVLSVYDKTRTKWLSVYRDNIVFSGRDNSNNQDEYARVGQFTSNQAGYKILFDATLVGITVQTRSAGTYGVQVRRNGNTSSVYALPVLASDNASDNAVNTDLNAGDEIQVYLDGSSIDRPLITLILAQRV